MEWKRYEEVILRDTHEFVEVNGKNKNLYKLIKVPAVRSKEGYIVTKEAQYSSSSRYYYVMLEYADKAGYLKSEFKTQKAAQHFCELLGTDFLKLLGTDMEAASSMLSDVSIKTRNDRW